VPIDNPVGEEVGAVNNLMAEEVSAVAPVSVESPNLPNVTGHLYVPANKSLSRIFSDTGSFRAGHVFDDGLVLESISDSQAVFKWRGTEYQIKLN